MTIKNIFSVFLLTTFLNIHGQVVIIPDAIFKNYLLADTTINTNQDALIQLSEAQALTHLNVSNKNILELTGINSFKNLTNLNCSNNQLSTLDISGNVELDTLICDANNLTSVCVNSKHFQNIADYSTNWKKDPTCEWSRTSCSIESNACFALFYTTFVDSIETFYGWVDSLSTEKAVGFNWDFGDLGITTKQPAPAYYYGKAKLYTICMKIYTASGDSCEYCHTIGYDSSRTVFKHGGGFNFRVMQFESTYIPDTTTGINQQASRAAIYSIQPNPTKDIINVAFNQEVKFVSIQLLNTSGQVLLEQKNMAGIRFTFDIKDLPAGMYILKVFHEDKISVNKLIKQ